MKAEAKVLGRHAVQQDAHRLKKGIYYVWNPN